MAPRLITLLLKKKRNPITARPRRKSQGRKKTTSRVQAEPDRLSELPDSLILYILSFLEMKDVVKTGTLSKRWKLLWTEVDTLVYEVSLKHQDFDMPVEELRLKWAEEMRLYCRFISNTLAAVSRVRVFSLPDFNKFATVRFNNSRVSEMRNEWVVSALEKNVQVLKLNAGMIHHPVTKVLYRSSSITKLKLRSVVIDLSTPVNWSKLTFLSLRSVLLTNDNLDNMLLGCPVLETLVFKEVLGLTRITIKSPSVKKLKLVEFDYSGDNVVDALEIRAPFLQELEILGNFIVKGCVIGDVSSLVKATINFSTYLPSLEDNYELDEDGDLYQFYMETEYNSGWIVMVLDLLKAICHVDELLIGSELLQVLTLSSVNHMKSPPFKCKNVTINSTLWKYDMPGMQYLFENMPQLETVILNLLSWQSDLPLTQTEGIFPHLASGHIYAADEKLPVKNFRINYFRNPKADSALYRDIGGKCPDTKLMAYFLCCCAGLQRLVLCSYVPCCYRTECSDSNCPCRYVSAMSAKVVSAIIPVAGEEWELRKRNFEFEFSFSDHAQGRIQEYFSKRTTDD